MVAPTCAGDAARDRPNDTIAAQTEAGKILFALTDIADQLGLDPSVSAASFNWRNPAVSSASYGKAAPPGRLSR